MMPVPAPCLAVAARLGKRQAGYFVNSNKVTKMPGAAHVPLFTPPVGRR